MSETEKTEWDDFLAYVLANNLTVEQAYAAVKAYQQIEALKDRVKTKAFFDEHQMELSIKQ